MVPNRHVKVIRQLAGVWAEDILQRRRLAIGSWLDPCNINELCARWQCSSAPHNVHSCEMVSIHDWCNVRTCV